MNTRVEIKVEGLVKTLDYVERLKALHQIPEGLKSTGQFLSDFFGGQVFDTEGTVFGEPWHPLSEKYRLWKARNYPGRGILERTGKLRRSFGFMSTSTYVRMFNTVKYFRKHQIGEGVPQRLMMMLDKTRTDQVVDIIKDAVVTKVRRF